MALIRTQSLARRQPRRRRLPTVLVYFYIAVQVVLGGVTGILIGAIILNWMSPGHPFFVAIRETLESIF